MTDKHDNTMKRKSYKWLQRLVDKITKTDEPNNGSFYYYGHEVALMSGTSDYVSVSIYGFDDRGRKDHIIEFNFDFLTKELVLETYEDYDQRDAIVKGFKACYEGWGITISDEPWENEKGDAEKRLGDDEYDQGWARKEYDKLMAHKLK